MNQQDVSAEMLEKAKQAATAEDLLALAKANGIALTTQQAAAAFAALHESGELADVELMGVSGGLHGPGRGKTSGSKGC